MEGLKKATKLGWQTELQSFTVLNIVFVPYSDRELFALQYTVETAQSYFQLW